LLPTLAKRRQRSHFRQNRGYGVPDRSQIVTIHLTATASNGDVLEMVTFTNGRCGLTRNGQPMADMEWELDRMNECTAALKRLAGLDGHTPP
jgi:hypothetical protein